MGKGPPTLGSLVRRIPRIIENRSEKSLPRAWRRTALRRVVGAIHLHPLSTPWLFSHYPPGTAEYQPTARLPRQPRTSERVYRVRCFLRSYGIRQTLIR